MPSKQSATTTATANTPSSLLSFVPRSVLISRLNMSVANAAVSSNGTTATKLDKKLLLQSIYRYLKSNGFSKTVKKLKSEAKLDEDELTDALILDLEEICSKHLETRARATEATRKSDQDLKSDGNEEDSSIERVSKKNKKVKNNDHAGAEDESGIKQSVAISTTEVVLENGGKTKEKKKKKKSSDTSNQEVKVKDNAPKGESENDAEKIKKKKKLRTTTDIATENAEKNSNDAASEKHQKSKKKKKSDSDSDAEESPLKTKESKKRKRVAAEDDSDKVVDASPDDKSNRIETGEVKGEDSVAKKGEDKLGNLNHIDELTNPNSGDKSSGRRSAKKPRNGSAEPTTVKAFQRVKVDEVVIKDERLKDNSYWAKDGAESGYGAKAQEILGQVRGKDFRHEKTKKKRGSYRGGQIDFDSHSIKFNDSDDE
ncbi:unnamed protein product [Rhodiola kirilowii]